MKQWLTAAAMAALLVACRGETKDTSGLPETETTGTAQAVSQTTTASATTTAAGGGTITNMTPEDKTFVVNAGMVGLAEVQMANLALQKASSADVKAYAQRMVTDHSTANAELAQLATTKGLALPTELGGEHKSGLEHLSALSGAEFDKAYMQHMVGDHQKAVQLFQTGSAASDTDVKAFAGKNLPILQQHLQLATEVSGKV
jgi:putative membrane protein